MEREQKPDGVDVPFGHELTRANPGEPLILIRAGATLAERLNAGLHVVTECANELIERYQSVRIDDAIKSAAAWREIIGSVAAALDEEANAVARYDGRLADRLRGSVADLRSILK